MALRVVTLSLVLRAISSRLIPLVLRMDATLQVSRGNVAKPAPVSLSAQKAGCYRGGHGFPDSSATAPRLLARRLEAVVDIPHVEMLAWLIRPMFGHWR